MLFTASDGIIIPMQYEYYALEGLSALMQTIDKIKSTTNTNLEITGLIRTIFDTRNNLSNEVSIQLLQYFSHKVFKTIIPRNVKLAEAPSFEQDVISYARLPKGAISYISLASEVLRKTLINQYCKNFKTRAWIGHIIRTYLPQASKLIPI